MKTFVSKFILIIAASIVFLCTACQKQKLDLTNTKQPADAPAYDQTANKN